MTATVRSASQQAVSQVLHRLCAGAVVWLGCSGAATSTAPVIPTSPVDIVGRITSISADDPLSRVAFVEFAPGEANTGPKALVTIKRGTPIVMVRSGNGSRFDTGGELGVLASGQWVRVWFSGPVADSKPVQAIAGTVVVDSLAPTVNR